MPDGETRTRAEAKAGPKFGQGFLTDIWYFAALSSDLKAGTRVALYGTKPASGQTASASVVLILPQGKANK